MNWNTYKSPNLGLLFYKQIYKERDILAKLALDTDKNELKLSLTEAEKRSKVNHFDAFYDHLCDFKISQYETIENQAATHRFCLHTTYPGLLIGSGYSHDTKAEGDFKIGFFFDHTTGQPIIPGSSVKGVLNSVFEGTDSVIVGTLLFFCQKLSNKYPKERAFWQQMLKEMTIDNARKLQTTIFGDEENPGTDIFFDAVINVQESSSKEQKFLAKDFLTPHKAPLKNPIPLQFLKVLPNVAFEFRFKINEVDKEWTANRKEMLFREILLTLGIGAKTNVGYGQWVDKNLEEDNSSKVGNTGNETKAVIPLSPQLPLIVYAIKGKGYPATVVEVNMKNKQYKIEFTMEDSSKKAVYLKFQKVQEMGIQVLTIKQVITLSFTEEYNSESTTFQNNILIKQ